MCLVTQGWGMIKARSVDILPRKRTKIEWPHLDVRSHMAVAMGGKCSWKSPVGENRCVLSEDVGITGKMVAAEVLGTLTSQKEPFSHSDMSTICSKSQWKFKIKIELTFMYNIKTWKNTAKRMIDFLPVTWKCCFYSAHFQPGGMFDYQRVCSCWKMRYTPPNTEVHYFWTDLCSWDLEPLKPTLDLDEWSRRKSSQ